MNKDFIKKNEVNFIIILFCIFSGSTLLAQNSFPCQGDTLFFENFSADTIPANWIVYDLDSKTPNDPITWTGTWEVKEVENDNVAANTSYYTPTGQSDDYLITPQIILPVEPACLSFKAKSRNSSWLESYQILISTIIPDTADTFNSSFFANSALLNVTNENSDWTIHTIDLAAYAGDTIYMAVWHNANDKDAIYIDNFLITKPFALDVSLNELNIKNKLAKGSYDVKGVIENFGSSAITSMNINWSLDGGVVQTDQLTAINITPYSTYEFTHSTQFDLNAAGAYELKVWTNNLNSQNDLNKSNDTLVAYTAVSNGTTTTKRMLIEEYTGAWVGVCPDGHYRLDSLQDRFNYKMIQTRTHYQDAMEIDDAAELINEYPLSFPSLTIDRVTWDDIDNDNNGKLDTVASINRDFWLDKMTNRLNEPSPVTLEMTKLYNSTTNTVEVTLKADFVDFVAGDVRFLAFVNENNVIGSGNGYDQQNFYNDNPQYPNHPMKGKGHPIAGYVHNEVLRALPLGPWGESGSLSSKISSSESFTKSFTINLGDITFLDVANLRIIGAVYVNNDDESQREILNSTIETIWTTGKSEFILNENNVTASVYPNPVQDISAIEFAIPKTSKVSLILYNSLGQSLGNLHTAKYAAGKHLYFVNAANFNNGIYFIKIESGMGVITKQFVVSK